MADYAISNVPRRVVYVNTGVGPYAFTFEILVATDIAVYRGSTLLTLTTDYTVTINTNGTGSVTLTTAGTGNITIVGARAIERVSDYTTNGDLFANTLNTDLDSQTIYSQQIAEGLDRSIKGSVTDSTALNMTLPVASSRANKLLGFNPSGEPAVSVTTINQLDAAVQSFVSGTGNNAASIIYTPAGSGAVDTTVQAKFRENVSVKDFGAVGDGVADDSQEIQAAIDYAFSVSKGIYFPSGTYKVNTGIQLKVGCEAAPNTQIRGGGAIDVVTIPPGNYANTYFNLPQIAFGTNGLVLNGVALATIFVPNVALCTDNGIVLQITNTNKTCADNVITFNTINGIANGAAIKFNHLATAISGTLMQGNQIKGNFAVSCKYGVYFYDVNNGSLGANLTWDDTEVDIFAIDPANLAGSIGFYANASFPAGRTFLYAKGFFDAMDDAYIKGNCISGPTFVISNSGQWDYTKFEQTGAARIINASSKQGNLPGVNPVPAMTTTYNTLASFNSGVPLQANRNILSFAIGDNLSNVVITGTAGQFSCDAATLVVGQPITITGTFGGTGSITGYTTGKIYYIITTNGSTTFTLSETYGGTAITTTAGTPTGLTYKAGIGPNQVKGFYFYHMLMSQYAPKVTAEPLWEFPMYVQSCNECSTSGLPYPGSANPYPLQGILVVRATGAVPAFTCYVAITVEDVTQ